MSLFVTRTAHALSVHAANVAQEVLAAVTGKLPCRDGDPGIFVLSVVTPYVDHGTLRCTVNNYVDHLSATWSVPYQESLDLQLVVSKTEDLIRAQLESIDTTVVFRALGTIHYKTDVSVWPSYGSDSEDSASTDCITDLNIGIMFILE